MKKISTPVVLILFKRPELTRKVIESISKVQPRHLYVIADGPREDCPDEKAHCDEARAIVEEIDWDCEIFKNYSDKNLGCQQRIYSGLNWVFDQVESAIILEDDCLAHPSFFPFCEELLQMYEDDERIAAISGNNFQFGRERTENSYYFSRYPHCWGWATWRRAWSHCDITMDSWPVVRQKKYLSSVFSNSRSIQYWTSKFQNTYEKKIDSWAFPWALSCWLQSELTILPSKNLVANIGFGADGTHHRSQKTPFANIPALPIEFPLKHPRFVVRNSQADAFTQAHQFGLLSRIWRKIRASLNI
mgnify:CR=1 FL=1